VLLIAPTYCASFWFQPVMCLPRVYLCTPACRFWDCCGSEDEAAPGCCVGFHISFDDELNEAKGWQ
jgi:hypothetical protein